MELRVFSNLKCIISKFHLFSSKCRVVGAFKHGGKNMSFFKVNSDGKRGCRGRERVEFGMIGKMGLELWV